MVQLTEVEKNIINELQGGFPLTERPYRDMAERLSMSERELIEHLSKLLDDGYISRFGPLYNVEKFGGEFCLCAMQVPEEKFSETTALVNAMKEVAHNYRRDHQFNMWFVLAVEHADDIKECIDKIQQQTQLQVFGFPKEREFFIGLKLSA